MSIKVFLKRLHIDRMYGSRRFDNPPLDVTGLSSGLNIVYGLNGAGKTTIARAIRHLLWPNLNKSGRAMLEARLEIDTKLWEIDIDGGMRIYKQQGKAENWPLSIDNVRPEIYHLSLHRLLEADKSDFAKEILREASGGYDVRKAAEKLKKSIDTKGVRKIKLTAEECSDKLKNLKNEQTEIWGKKEKLQQLKETLTSIRHTKTITDLHEKAITYHQTREEHEKAKTLRGNFSPYIENIHAGVITQYKDLKDETKTLRTTLSEIDKKIEQADSIIAETTLSGRKLPTGILEDILSRSQNLKTTEALLEENEVPDLAELDSPEKDTQGLKEEKDILREANAILLQWLEIHDSQTGVPAHMRTPLIFGIIATLVIALALGILFGWLWLILLLVPFFLGALLPSAKKNVEHDRRKTAQQDEFEKLPVKQPSEWTSNTVRQICFQNLPEQQATLDNRIEHARRWEKRERARGKVTEALDKMNSLLQHHGLKPVSNATEGQEYHRELVVDQKKLQDARASHAQAIKEKKASTDNLDKKKRYTEELFQRFGLAPEDGEPGLQNLLTQRDDFQKARNRELEAKAAVTTAEKILRNTAGFKDEMLYATIEELSTQLENGDPEIGQEDALQKEITEITMRISDAEAGNDITATTAETKKAMEDLAHAREKAYQQAVGDILAKHLLQKTHKQNLPDVFHRAKDLFLAVTNGRYELDLGDDAFRAYDTIIDKNLGLDELSSGTRIQLLLCVRIAFVETQEGDWRLPMTFDEALANSDDERAKAIIDVISHLAKHRQVFYFTAQQDEVTKWQQLTESGTCSLYSLNGNLPTPKTIDPDALPPSLKKDVPQPGDSSHGAYGKILQVAPWNARDPIGSLHLWYLIEDVPALYATLSDGKSTWGPLQTLLRSPLREALPLDQSLGDQLLVLGKAMDAWQKAWKIGRGKPVDEDVLEQLGKDNIISNKFMNPIAKLCDQCNGDGKALIEALLRGDIKAFRSAKINDLHEYLKDNGHISDNDVLAPEEILSRVYRTIQDDLAVNGMDHHHVDRLLERIRQGPQPSA